MDFFGKHRRPTLDEGVMDPVSKTESAGYIPADVQINMFIEAGRRLDKARIEAYDFGPNEEVPEDFIDPTRSGDFDLADASRLGKAVASSLNDQAKNARSKKEAEKLPEKMPDQAKEEKKE